MDNEQRVRCAIGGDVKAFVELTRQFQYFAFGSALALVKDFHQGEDAVQEAFVTAWAALPGLTDPAAFPSLLPGIYLGSRRFGSCGRDGCQHGLSLMLSTCVG